MNKATKDSIKKIEQDKGLKFVSKEDLKKVEKINTSEFDLIKAREEAKAKTYSKDDMLNTILQNLLSDIKVSKLSPNGYVEKVTTSVLNSFSFLSEEKQSELKSVLENHKAIKGTRSNLNDTKDMQELRKEFKLWLKNMKNKGLVDIDFKYMDKTSRTRYTLVDSIDQTKLISLNIGNLEKSKK